VVERRFSLLSVITRGQGVAALYAWYHSPQYRDLRDLRWSAAGATILLADGVTPDVAPGSD
jgi:uncharacterized protein (DUF1330 family)